MLTLCLICLYPILCNIQPYISQGPEKRAELGIKDNLIRFSCGIEDVEDIWADMVQALDRI